jgi:hypothetical protein
MTQPLSRSLFMSATPPIWGAVTTAVEGFALT